MPQRNEKGSLWVRGRGTGPNCGNNARTSRDIGRGSGRCIGTGMGQGIVRSKMFVDKIPYTHQRLSLQNPQQTIMENQELDALKQQIQMLQYQANSILSKIDKLSHTKQNISRKTILKASVITKKCTGCGICVDYCNREAITLADTAKIDLNKCTGCSICVDMCPNEALILR